MTSAFHHGVRVIEVNEGTRTIRVPSTSVIGIVATATAADNTTFPLDEPVLVTDIAAALAKAGTGGTLKRALDTIDKLARAMVVVVRVAEGEDDEDTTANIIGTVLESGKKTGLKALLSAEQKLGVKPRLLGVPELDTPSVTAELIIIAKKLRAFCYASCFECETKEDAVEYRDDFSARELMLLWPNVMSVAPGAALPSECSAVAFALGLRAQIDTNVGWHKTLSNVVIDGALGISNDVFFDLQDPATDAGYLNQNEITTLVNSRGFRFWGNRTTSSDPLFAFENYTRTGQVIADMVAEAHLWAVDMPLHPSLARDIIESLNQKFRELRNARLIVDATAWLDPEINTVDTLKAGKLRIDYDYTPVPPLEDLGFNQRITDHYLANFADSVNR